MPSVHERDLSVCASEPTVGFAEKGFVRQEEMLYPSAGNQLGLEYRYREPKPKDVNPQDGMPTLMHGGKVVVPSRALIDCFYDAFTQPPARPADACLRRQMRALPGLVVELMGGDSPERRERALQLKMNSASRAGARKAVRGRRETGRSREIHGGDRLAGQTPEKARAYDSSEPPLACRLAVFSGGLCLRQPCEAPRRPQRRRQQVPPRSAHGLARACQTGPNCAEVIRHCRADLLRMLHEWGRDPGPASNASSPGTCVPGSRPNYR